MSNLSKGWSSSTLGELAKYHNGAAFKPSDWEGKGIPIIRIQNLTDPVKTSQQDNPEGKGTASRFEMATSWSAGLRLSTPSYGHAGSMAEPAHL